MPTVTLLDTNVLWSAALRDLLLRLAREGAYQPIWSEQILGEMVRTLVARRDLEPTAIKRTAALMREYFPRAMVVDYEHRIPAMRNNPGDRHVLAAAVEAQARIIVTFNRRHFPAAACDPYGIEVQSPDGFLCRLWETDRRAVVRGLRRQAAGLRNPPRTPRDILQGLRRTVPEFASHLLEAGVVD